MVPRTQPNTWADDEISYHIYHNQNTEGSANIITVQTKSGLKHIMHIYPNYHTFVHLFMRAEKIQHSRFSHFEELYMQLKVIRWQFCYANEDLPGLISVHLADIGYGFGRWSSTLYFAPYQVIYYH